MGKAEREKPVETGHKSVRLIGGRDGAPFGRAGRTGCAPAQR